MKYTLEWMMENARVNGIGNGIYHLYQKAHYDDDIMHAKFLGRYLEEENIFSFLPIVTSGITLNERLELMKNFKAFIAAHKLAGKIS